jgi:hypothetical protein
VLTAKSSAGFGSGEPPAGRKNKQSFRENAAHRGVGGLKRGGM